MLVLVDYDNLEKSAQRLGIAFIANSIVSKFNPAEIPTGTPHATLRMYGGWYQNTQFTTRAQTLSADISSNFPTTCTLSDGLTKIIVRCEMAYSLLAAPTNHLFHTFRSRGIPEGLKANHPGLRGCAKSPCPIIETYNFVTNDICSNCKSLRPSDIFYRGEQKLVDTMITSDLIYSASQVKTVCIVSSDDDFWPGILTTLKQGADVVHIQTKVGATPANVYSRLAGKGYTQRAL